MATRRYDKTALALYGSAGLACLSLFLLATMVYTNPRQACASTSGIDRYFSNILPSIVAMTPVMIFIGVLAYKAPIQPPYTIAALLLTWSVSIIFTSGVFSVPNWPAMDCEDL